MFDAIFYGSWIDRDRLTPPRIAYLALLWVGIPIGILFWMLNLLASAIVGGALASYSHHADVGFRKATLTWTGDIVASDVHIDPHEDADDNIPSFVAKRVLIDLPSWGVWMQGMGILNLSGKPDEMDSEAIVSAIDHVGFEVEGMHADFHGHLPGVLGVFGMESAAPFEADGCVGDRQWGAGTIALMRIQNDGVNLRMAANFDLPASEIHLQGKLEAPGAGQVAFNEVYKALLDKHQVTLAAQHIEATDAGFVAARDAYCAKRDHITLVEFRERNIAAIQRNLATRGFHAGMELEEIFRKYLAGQTLILDARPNTHIAREDYGQYSVADQQKMYNATIAVGTGAPRPLVFEEAPRRPYPADFKGSDWDLVVLDREGGSEAVADAPAPAQAPVPVAVVVATPVVAPAPASTPPAATSPEDDVLAYEDLAHHVGDSMAITTTSGTRYVGSVESYSSGEIMFKTYVIGGYSIQNFSKSRIRSIRWLR